MKERSARDGSRDFALATALVAIALVVAQDVVPSWPRFHDWMYAALLGLGAAVILGYLRGARRDRDVARFAFALLGALVVIAAGLASGLLGPDTETVARAPGTVAPLPDAGVAAFFPNADARSIARGDSAVVLRKRDGSSDELAAGSRRFFGATALELKPQAAAYVEARDARGERLTITQPTNASFLSPVLFFPQTVSVAGRALPADAFAAPAVHRQIKAFYFSTASTAESHVHGLSGTAAVLFAVDDDNGKLIPGGIGFATSGREVSLGGLRLRATLGTYPALVVSAVPVPSALWFGAVAFVLGLAFAFRTRARRAVPALAALAIAAAAATGCTRIGGAPSGGAHLHAWTHPDTLRIGLYEEPDALDPVISSMSFGSDVFQLVFDGLIRFDDRGNPVPDLAREVPSVRNGGISRDGRTLTYHLMPNARWHDGQPVTARDVIFTWRQIMNPNNFTPTRYGYDRILSIDAPDPHTVRVHLNGPYPPALYLFRDLIQGAIVPEHLLRGRRDLNRAPFNAHPIGSGPYVFASWLHGGEMRFDANPHYFRGTPKIAHVVLRFIPDQNTLLAQLRAHEIDLYYGVPPYQASQVAKIDGIDVRSTSTLHWEHLAFNTRRAPLDDVAVRRALCYAVDLAGMHRKIYFGLGTIGPTHFNPDYPWGDPAVRPYPFDPAKAQALLEAAGWHLGPDRIRHKGGRPLAFAISTVAGVKTREAIEVFLQSAWRAIGVDLEVKNYPAATLFAPFGAGGLLDTGKTDVSLFTWENSTPDPDDETYISPARPPPAGQNVTFYLNPEIGRLQQEALGSYDPAVRNARYAAIERILIRDVPEYVLDWLPEVTASNVDLHGVRPVPVGSDLWNVADWSF